MSKVKTTNPKDLGRVRVDVFYWRTGDKNDKKSIAKSFILFVKFIRFEEHTGERVKGALADILKKAEYKKDKKFYYHTLQKVYTNVGREDFLNIMEEVRTLFHAGRKTEKVFPTRVVLKPRQARKLWSNLFICGFQVKPGPGPINK